MRSSVNWPTQLKPFKYFELVGLKIHMYGAAVSCAGTRRRSGAGPSPRGPRVPVDKEESCMRKLVAALIIAIGIALLTPFHTTQDPPSQRR
jgi:hypothetical protein